MHYKVAAFFHLKPPEGTPTPKWVARRSLKNLRKASQEEIAAFRPLYEAIMSNKLPQYCLAALKQFKSYSDALPSEAAVGEWHPDYPKMKCRAHAILGIAMKFDLCVDERLIKSEHVSNAIERYKKHEWSYYKGKHVSRTTPEEIKLINDTLDIVIDYLKTTYKLE